MGNEHDNDGGCEDREHMRRENDGKRGLRKMSERSGMRFGVKVDKMWQHHFSIGICICHWGKETYLLMNLFKWIVAIGFLYYYGESEDCEE